MTAITYALLFPLLVGAPSPARTPAPVAETAPRSLGPVGLAGILVGAAGVGLASAGIARLAGGESRATSPSDQELIVVTDPHPQGRAFLGAGLGVAAIGLTALALDLTLLRKRRRMAVAPVLGPTTAGLLVHGRFEVRPWR